MNKESAQALLKKFMDNTCTKEELEQVNLLFNNPGTEALFQEILNERWIDIPEQPANQQQMQQWKAEFNNRLKASEHDAKINKQNAGTSKQAAATSPTMIKTLPSPPNNTDPGYSTIPKYSTALKYAAILAVAFMGVAFLSLYLKKQPLPQIAMQEISNPLGRSSQIALPDGSIVFLGPASKIRFPKKFTGNTREIELEGEAFFEVVHLAKQPLIVRTGNIQTRDLGTSFKITAFKNQAYRVAVTSGKVSLEQLNNKATTTLATLIPGDRAVWDHKKVSTDHIVIADVNGWKDGRLVFNATPLRELANEIERFYGVNIQFKNAAKAKMQVSTVLTTADTPVKRIMNALSVSAHFRYTIKGSNIIID